MVSSTVQPILVMPAAGLRGLHLAFLLAGAGALFGVLVVPLAVEDALAPALIIMASTLFTLSLIWVILPQRFELWPDRLALVFPLWRWNIPYASIQAVEEARWWEPYGFWGVRFATGPSQGIVVRRVRPTIWRRPNLVISPVNRAVFIARLRAELDHGPVP